jgi:hypothetical protein
MRAVCLAGVCVLTAAQGLCVQLASAQGSGTDSTFLYFSGADLWRDSFFVHSGLLWSPDALGRDGFTLKVMSGGGVYRYRSGALGNAQVIGRELSAAILPGWRFTRGKVAISVFAGVDARVHWLFPADPGSRLNATAFGLRGALDLWYQIDPDTMIAADASASSIGPSYIARAAFGWRLFDSFYAGPEVQVLGDNDYRQLRVGAHLTGLKTDIVEWTGALGQAWDSDGRASAYGRLGFILRD